MRRAGAPRRVVLHVGTPKSGTTYLQRALWDSRTALARLGAAGVGSTEQALFRGAVEVREAYDFWGLPRTDIEGTWRRLCQEARRYPGIAIMSHELLGAASPEQAARARAELDGAEVHVVVTARDLVRQVTSEWQELVKNGGTAPFSRFARRIVRDIETGNFSSIFWRNQDLTGILERWAPGLPPQQVHLVVAPRVSSDPHELWRRFAAAAGFDGSAVLPRPSRVNASLGEAQIAVLRKVNQVLDDRMPMGSYLRVVKEGLAEDVLAAQTAEPLRCPPALAARLREIALDRNEAIAAAGYRVHGSLEDLVPAVPEKLRGKGKRRVGEARSAARNQAYAEALARLLLDQAEGGRGARRGALARRWQRSGRSFRRP